MVEAEIKCNYLKKKKGITCVPMSLDFWLNRFHLIVIRLDSYFEVIFAQTNPNCTNDLLVSNVQLQWKMSSQFSRGVSNQAAVLGLTRFLVSPTNPLAGPSEALLQPTELVNSKMSSFRRYQMSQYELQWNVYKVMQNVSILRNNITVNIFVP